MQNVLVLLLFCSVHGMFQSERLLCSSGKIVSFANLDSSSLSKQHASLRAAELGGRLPTSQEVRELIFSNKGPLFRNQVWVPVSENDYIQVGVNEPLIPKTCFNCKDSFVYGSNDFSLDCQCQSRGQHLFKTMISYSTCENSEVQNVDGSLVCVKKKLADSKDCSSMYDVAGLGHSFNLCRGWITESIKISKILYVNPSQIQIQKSIQSCSPTKAYLYYSNPCPTGFTCISSVCVDMTKAHAQVMKFGMGPPNNVYFAFSLWDDHCRPIALPMATLSSKLQVYQKIPGKLHDQFVRQSVKESWNGATCRAISL